MADTINGQALFASGGHRWLWGPVAAGEKVLRSGGMMGAVYMKTWVGENPGMIVGVFKASGATRLIADTALNALEKAVTDLADSAWGEFSWEDDQGHTGAALRVREYEPAGPRTYGRTGATVTVWQSYRISVIELAGGVR